VEVLDPVELPVLDPVELPVLDPVELPHELSLLELRVQCDESPLKHWFDAVDDGQSKYASLIQQL
jgi:hypothetical protein